LTTYLRKRERRKEKGERRKEKGERRKEKCGKDYQIRPAVSMVPRVNLSFY